MLIQKTDFESLAEKVFSKSRGDETEILLSTGEDSLTRFADNAIHQNLRRKDLGVIVRVHLGEKIGRASTNSISDEALKRVVQNAYEIASHQTQSPDFMPMPEKQEYRTVDTFDADTAFLTPTAGAEQIREALEACKNKSLQTSGSFSSGFATRAIANSKGVRAVQHSTAANFTITASFKAGSGWAEQSSFKAADLSGSNLAAVASEKALAGADPIQLEPGRYTVILEPAAAAEFLLFMSYYGFGALAVLEGRSFLSGKIGERVFGGNVTITDDAYHELCRGLPFDYEGMPRQKVVLIERGIAKSLVHDRKTAKAMGMESTGHALPQPNPYGPIPENLVMEPGETSMEDMIASVERGILVTQLHYCNVEDQKRMILTGLTRNGTFLVENGRITRGIRNFRFTESAIKVFNGIEMISKERKLVGAFFGGEFVVPALKVKDFTFTSKAEL